jgi:hypothetical protein
MAEPFLIIDGYNLMHAAGMTRRRYGPGDFQRCRRRFLAFLARHLSPAERERATVVFDAIEAPAGLSRTSTLEGMSVVFAQPGGDADTLIEELIAKHSAPRQIQLVSSDHRLQKAARRRRAQFVDSERFIARLHQRGEAGRPAQDSPAVNAQSPEKFSGPLSDAETSEWLEVFGDIPEAAELESAAERLQEELDNLADEIKDDRL